jgi:hypothetical protein
MPEDTANYGSACQNCAVGKAKCVRSDERSGTCDRCNRLRKECQPAAKRRKLKPSSPGQSKGKPSSSSNVERKLDELVSLLRRPTDGPLLSTSGHAEQIIAEGAIGNRVAEQKYLEPSSQEAAECLTTFVECHIKYFPFFYLQPGWTAPQLRQERPLLWLAMMSIASKSTMRQRTRAEQLRQTMVEQIFRRTELSIDLLLAILAYIAW